jgi:hypothetical protein
MSTNEQEPKKKRNIKSKVTGTATILTGAALAAAGTGIAGAAHQIPRLIDKGEISPTLAQSRWYTHLKNNNTIKKVVRNVKRGGVGAAVLGVAAMHAGYKAVRTRD